MPVVDLIGLPKLLKPGQRLAGLDVGSKTIGVAVSDVMRTLATPLETVKRGKFLPDAQRLFDIARRYDVGGLVVGLPLALDGSEGPRCQSVRQFAANLLAVQDLPLAFQDERLSTAAVERVLIEDLDMTRRRRAEVVDRAAAAYILQGALDRLANLARSAPPSP
ncbi:MAG: Holliday junction resolvase RuvX [Reyranellaceae bacterium]